MRPQAEAQQSSSSSDIPLPRSLEEQVNEQTATISAEVLGAQYRHKQRQEFEQTVDTMLDSFIKIARARLDAFTIAIFFPSNDGGYKLRRYQSPSEHINAQATIYPGVGVIGSFLKDGLRQLKLQEIVTDSMTLYYYTKDAGIRSLMASPIIAGGSERGTIIVDSDQKKHFSDEDHAFLTTLAGLLGQTIYQAYLYNEQKLSHDRLASMSTIEKDFFTHPDMDAILDKMVEIIPFAIACDRLTISLKNEDGKSAVVQRVWGASGEGLLNLAFPLDNSNLISLVYQKNLCLFRDYSRSHYEVRYAANEPTEQELSSFLAYPFGVQECSGTLLLESFRPNAFSEEHHTLLRRLTTSAGLAIEKLRLLERANALATHDGLTGLFNHRQFQSLLADEVSRVKRYNDPLTLVLCDIDFFKRLNDTYGHPFGDLVLKGVSARLQESVRDRIDVAARYGGEEFALVFVKTDLASALQRTERIRESIENIPFRTEQGETVHVTMSFGLARFGEHAKSAEALVKRADKALYKAKENGRNRLETLDQSSGT
jgi:diguanylate cyclase (GGDEF)-like protein